MTRFRHALVIGKFYPPHAGHEYLIRTAASAARCVTVVVMAADIESLRLELRVAWLREIFSTRSEIAIVGVVDNDVVDFHSDSIWSRHVDHMRRGIAQADAARDVETGPIDVVFTSEPYGTELARRFDAASVCLDQGRKLHPISATAVRRDPASCWEFLAPCVREYLCRRIVVVGAESTGKSTLSASLVTSLRSRGGIWARTNLVEEYGREYTLNKIAIEQALRRRSGLPDAAMEDLRWKTSEFEYIAVEQQRRENAAAAASSPVLICDTDAFATSIWHERYVGAASPRLAASPETLTARLGYILTSWDDIPFEQDGLRDGEHIRGWMHDRFAAQLTAQGIPWFFAGGTREQRLATCLEWIDERLSAAWSFADPLG